MAQGLKILFLSPEAVPFAKTGGLGDVAGSLPPALRRLGVDVRRVLMVGDSGNDVACARAAGAPVVVVPYGYREGRAVQDLAADAIVDSLDDLPERDPQKASQGRAAFLASAQEMAESAKFPAVTPAPERRHKGWNSIFSSLITNTSVAGSLACQLCQSISASRFKTGRYRW